jgi:lysophospholipase L1-like esterase
MARQKFTAVFGLAFLLIAAHLTMPGCNQSTSIGGTGGTLSSSGSGGIAGSGGSGGNDAGTTTKVDALLSTGGQDSGTRGGAGGMTMEGGKTGLGGTSSTGGKTGAVGGSGTGGMTGVGGKTGAKDGGGIDVVMPDSSQKDTPVADADSGGTDGGKKDISSLDIVTGSDGSSATNITIWLAGDSTVANGSTPCPVGWGKQFQALFNSKVKVTNSAQGGRSVQTWLYDVSDTMGSNGECTLNSTTYLSAWTTMLSGMKAGDYLFIQFGINDGDSSCNRHVGTALFKSDYGMMAQAAKDRGATPIFVTPVSSISCSGTTAKGTRGSYATATKEAGTTYDVPVIDLEQLSVALYSSLGFCPLPGPDTTATFQSGAIGDFFCEDHTHFEAAGATQIAKLVAQAVKDQGIGLASYLQ